MLLTSFGNSNFGQGNSGRHNELMLEIYQFSEWGIRLGKCNF